MSDPSARPYDLIVFGATGFAGSVAAEYLASHAPAGLRWAIAGRSRGKLDDVMKRLAGLPSKPAEAFAFDNADRARVFEHVGQTRVAACYAGPFARYGENLVAACAELGTHYVDITGETLWVRRMIDLYEEKARASGAVLVPFSGFDSVPSDLGAWRAVERAHEAHPGKAVTKVVSLVSARGGFNGGTFATMLDMLALGDEDLRRFEDPALLVPPSASARFRFPPVNRPVHVREEHVVAPPFFMEPINSRVVYRSQALREAGGGADAPPFQYVELMKLPGSASAVTSWAVVAGSGLFNRIGRIPWAHRLLEKHGPKPGQGPSAEERAAGFFRARFFAYHHDELLARFEMAYPGDPGNKATAVLSCESALCLVEGGAERPKVPGGFWTPSTALGAALYERLERAGVTFA